MKAILENVEYLKGAGAFVAYSCIVPFFEFKWHYHPEYELTLITEGRGKRVVGDSHESFGPGDLVLIGPELPHTWSSEKRAASTSSAVVIQFSSGFIERFSTLHECKRIFRLLEESARGRFFAQPPAPVLQSICELPGKSGLARIVSLLEILESLCGADSSELSSSVYSGSRSSENASRINKVCRYVYENAADDVTLAKAASLVSLSKSAFCKFFRRTMKMNFSDYVNEIRIANACLLLSDTDMTVRQVASDSGFDSLTYFNRVFRKKKGTTPVKFRLARP